jgi:CRISPR-associated endonuclease Cas1
LASPTIPQSPAIQQISKHGVLVLWGFGIKLRIDREHLFAEWGVGLKRYQARLSRVEGRKLRRVILLSSDGYISLESLRFVMEVGVSLAMIDKRGKALLVCSPVAPSDSKLKRGQSLALGNGTALRISREIIRQKVDEQATLVRDMLHDDATADAILRFRDELQRAENLVAVREAERSAALAYWHAWSDVSLRWARKDERRVPAHWKVFGSRISPLTHSPRLAINPAGSLLNFLYCLLENETRIAIVAMGMLPEIGLLHADVPNRDSLVFDLMEVCRPKVDAFVLNFLQNEVFRKADWWEDRNGNCRMVTALAIKLCETSDTWRKFCAPVAEYVAGELWRSIRQGRISKSYRPLASRLTQEHRREAKGRKVPAVELPKPAHGCRDCGAPLRRQDGARCSKCARLATRKNLRAGRKSAQQSESLAKRAATQHEHQAANRAWNPANLPAWLDRDAYLNRIVPALGHVPKSEIRQVLGVSESYSIYIQTGMRIPHARHWLKLAQIARIA